MIVVCQCSFIDCHKRTTLAPDIGGGEAVPMEGRRYTGMLCTLRLFCRETKTALKDKVCIYFFKCSFCLGGPGEGPAFLYFFFFFNVILREG